MHAETFEKTNGMEASFYAGEICTAAASETKEKPPFGWSPHLWSALTVVARARWYVFVSVCVYVFGGWLHVGWLHDVIGSAINSRCPGK